MKTSKKKQPIVGITMGDPAGIGPEIVAKALANPGIRRLGHFKIIGDYDIFRKYCPNTFKNCTFIDIPTLPANKIKIGHPNKYGAEASLAYLKKAIELVKTKEITSLVTAPLCKETISALGKKFYGHTEFLAQAFKVKNFDMMFTCAGTSDKQQPQKNTLRTIVVTRHIPLNDVSKALTINKIYSTIKLANNYLKKFFKIKHPRIAVCGLNPHAGEGGSMGKEEITRITPAILKAQKERINAEGPFPADTLFSPDIGNSFDVVIAMYHDQGLIPVKTLYFTKIINVTIGLPFIRTSPAHGTAFNIAGKNKANPSSLSEAVKLAAMLSS